jgi:hypothetical protein
MNSLAFKFLLGDSSDFHGRRIFNLISLNDFQFLGNIGAATWMFPVDVESNHSKEISPLFEWELKEFGESESIKQSLRHSFCRIYNFYSTNELWVMSKSCEYIKLTRILRCLWLAGLKVEYVKLQKFLDEVYLKNSISIGVATFLCWKRANADNFSFKDIEDLTKEEEHEACFNYR